MFSSRSYQKLHFWFEKKEKKFIIWKNVIPFQLFESLKNNENISDYAKGNNECFDYICEEYSYRNKSRFFTLISDDLLKRFCSNLYTL